MAQNNDIKHKVFISYYHEDDQYYKDKFEALFGDIFINKSVGDGDIDDDLSANYIKRLIQEGYLTDTSVLVVLVGKNTYKRKHVDWEISAALSKKVGGYSGLLGLCLPDHPAYGKDEYSADDVPPRLVDNLKSGYAKLYDWTTSEKIIKARIEDAFDARINRKDKIDDTREQFKKNR
ncbi:TIR domain-containing protein [Desulfitobacterium sp. AusDCA]|uniref:TIR domain-containing protein n=1 Tax=Desulfitobacterium sp. AusDCA TaxID=3240383 RepID=UPI003DA7335F